MQRGRNGVTSNLACISILSNKRRPVRSLLIENHQSICNLGHVLFDHQSDNVLRETNLYADVSGIELLIRKLERGLWLNEDDIIQVSRPLPIEDMYYVPGYPLPRREIAQYELSRHLKPLCQAVENFSQTVYFDVSGGQDSTNCREILSMADLVVINLSQNPYVLQSFFRNFHSLRDKSFYLISNYNQDSMYSKDRISSEFHIAGKRLGVIPYHAAFGNAAAEGHLVPFLQENYSCHSDNIHYDFIQTAKETADKIEDFAAEMQRKGRTI